MKQFFYPEYIPWEDCYTISIGEEVYREFPYCKSSFNVLFCRLLGLNYADGWRYIRDNFNGKVKGKEGKFCSVSFNSIEDCEKICLILNKRWSRFYALLCNYEWEV